MPRNIIPPTFVLLAVVGYTPAAAGTSYVPTGCRQAVDEVMEENTAELLSIRKANGHCGITALIRREGERPLKARFRLPVSESGNVGA
jgi:hypothetical protein